MKRRGRIQTLKLVSLALALMLLASLPAAASPAALKPIGPVSVVEPVGGIMYEDEYVTVEYVEEQPEAAQSGLQSAMAATGSVSMTVSTPSVVSTLPAYLEIRLTGQSIPNNTAKVYLSVNGQKVSETAITGNAARMYIAEAPAPGQYWLIAYGADGEIARCGLEVVPYNLDIWTPEITTNADGKTVVVFADAISAKDGTLSGKVTVNGVVKSASFGADGCSVIIETPYNSLREDDKIALTGIKYPRLFPSYSFTFTLKYSETVRYPLEVSAGRVYYVALTGHKKENIRAIRYTVKYDASVLELVDAAAQTPAAEVTQGLVNGGGISIQSHTNGILVFTCTRPETEFSGALTVLKFRAKADGETVVTLR